MDRLLSGSARLDEVLGGGLPVNGINLISGLPGSGKTMLAEQYVFENATERRPAVYLATMSEPFDKMIRYGQELNFFDRPAIGRRVFFGSLSDALQQRGLDGALDEITTTLRERTPGILVIDSFKAVAAFAPDAQSFRRFVSELAERLSATPTSVFWVGEYASEEPNEAPEFAVADAIITFRTDVVGTRQMRTLRVLKLRGSAYLSGEHAYRLSADGVHVFPRLADVSLTTGYDVGLGRVSMGVPEIDRMLDGGLFRSSSTLLAGPSGAGKTVLALHYLGAGAEAGEPVLLASLQENESQIRQTLEAFGIDQSRFEILYRSPVDLYIDEWVYEVLDTAARIGARRIVIDSINDLGITVGEETRLREYLYSLSQRCSRLGISLLLTFETTELTSLSSVSEGKAVSNLADNVILLRYSLQGSEIGRALAVLKTRGSGHDLFLRPFTISPKGVSVAAAPSTGDDLPRLGRPS
ncbi:MAG: RAD55 family ATPase [Candidatus Limnocylindrales bacterium]